MQFKAAPLFNSKFPWDFDFYKKISQCHLTEQFLKLNVGLWTISIMRRRSLKRLNKIQLDESYEIEFDFNYFFRRQRMTCKYAGNILCYRIETSFFLSLSFIQYSKVHLQICQKICNIIDIWY